MTVHEVKGTAFVTLREWVVRQHGHDALQRILDALPEEHRSALAEPMAFTWHPEEVHHEVLRALHASLCEGDIHRYHKVILGACELGVHKFSRLVLQMTSDAFVLRRAPTMWRILRRGPASLSVTQEGLVSRLTYSDFPYFDDVLYRRYIVALLAGIVRTSAGYEPPIRIVDPTPEKLVIEIQLQH